MLQGLQGLFKLARPEVLVGHHLVWLLFKRRREELNQQAKEGVKVVDKLIHRNLAVFICVDVVERVVAELFRDRNAQLILLEELDQEHAKFLTVEVAILVSVKFDEVRLNLILQVLWPFSVALKLSDGSEELSLFEFFGVNHLVVIENKALKLCKVRVGVEKDF